MVLLAFIGVALVAICLSDVIRRRIPNALVLFVLANTLLLNGLYGSISGIYSAIFVFVLTVILVRLRVIAAGDSKLATALAVATPLSQLTFALWLTAMIGGVIALFYWVKYRVVNTASQENDPGLPYGLAISVGFYLPLLAHYL